MSIYSYAHVYMILICSRVHCTHMFTCSPVHMSVCTHVHILICSRVHNTHMLTCTLYSYVHVFTCTHVCMYICSYTHMLTCTYWPIHTRTHLVSTCSLAHICHTQLLMYSRITFTQLRIMCHICTPVTLPTISPTHACARESVRMLTLCIGVPARTHRQSCALAPTHSTLWRTTEQNAKEG